MKKKALSAFAVIATLGIVFAQISGISQIGSSPAQGRYFGTQAPPPGLCQGSANVGATYTKFSNPSTGFSGHFICMQTGAASNSGIGGFQWVALQALPAGTTPSGGGTLTVASGKAAVISKSLTFTGTDGTTETFPSTSATIARTDAAQTFTGVQTFSSAPVLSTGTITNTGTVTLPTATGGLGEVFFCGATSGTTTCANTSGGATARAVAGIATLASNSAVISSISPAFTSTSTFSCTGQDITTRANPVQVVQTSSSSITITNTTGASDVVNWVCIGY